MRVFHGVGRAHFLLLLVLKLSILLAVLSASFEETHSFVSQALNGTGSSIRQSSDNKEDVVQLRSQPRTSTSNIISQLDQVNSPRKNFVGHQDESGKSANRQTENDSNNEHSTSSEQETFDRPETPIGQNYSNESISSPAPQDRVKDDIQEDRTPELTRSILASGQDSELGRSRRESLPAPADDAPVATLSGSLAKRKLLLKTTAPSMLISGLINAKVSLPCDISPPSAEDSVALILWYKDDSMAPIFTLDARKETQLERARVSIDEAYQNRASFSHSSKPAALQLEQVRLDDEGDYRCRVDFRRGRTVNTIISLRVIIPPDDVRIVSPARPGARLEGHIGPLNEGQELVLLCVARGGKPRPQLTWRHDYSVIDETFQRLDKEGASNELRIPALTRSHLLSKFTCQANNSQPINAEITLDLNLKPQEISLRQLGAEPLVIGQNATFECLSSGSQPHATIHWLFQGVRHQPPTEFLQQQSLSRLTLTLQRSFNQQPLTCVAENERLGGPNLNGNPSGSGSSPNSIRQTVKLDVQYAPQLSIRLEPQKTGPGTSELAAGHQGGQPERVSGQQNGAKLRWSPQQGNDIYLSCQMDANPRPIKPILWRHNGHLISQQLHESQQTVVTGNQSLVLRKISPSQSGAYTCESSNPLGSNASLPLELNVRHAPVCATDDILIYEAVIGQTIAVDCHVIANPSKSVHFSWFKSSPESNLTNWIQRDASLDEQIDDSSQSLKIKLKDSKSFGQFKCKAKNEIGLQQKACLFLVLEAQLPKLLHSCRQEGVSSANSIAIACDPNEHLKSDEFELTQAAGGPPKSAAIKENYWPLGLDSSVVAGAKSGAYHHSEPGADSNSVSLSTATRNQFARTRARIVYPARWLLVEVYKVSGSNDNELVSYVIAGSLSQLATIKSLVEINQVFKSNPKGTYYVMTRPRSPSRSPSINDNNGNIEIGIGNININGSGSGSDSGGDTQTTNHLSSGPDRLAPMNRIGAGHHHSMLMSQQTSHEIHHRPPGDDIIFSEDPSIQLAPSFRFIIPNLEPETRYKLMIFAQNVASKTRDWIALRADTQGAEPLESRSRTLNSGHQAKSNQNETSDDLSMAPGADNGSSQLQKSLVMTRSDNLSSADRNSAGGGGEDPTMQNSGQLDSAGARHSDSKDSAGFGSRFLEVAARKWPMVQSQFGQYADKAVVFARQRPLISLPVALISAIALVFILIWLINLLSSRTSDHDQKTSANDQRPTTTILKTTYDSKNSKTRRRSDAKRIEREANGSNDSGSRDSCAKSPGSASPNDDEQHNNRNHQLESSASGSSSESGGAKMHNSNFHPQQVFAICSGSPLNRHSHSNSAYSDLASANRELYQHNQHEIIVDSEQHQQLIGNSEGAYLMTANWHGSNAGAGAAIGSLDRRSSILFQQHQNQPIYLRTLVSDPSQMPITNGFNSIDRSQQPVHLHKSANANQRLNLRKASNQAKANQRVAFDLSPHRGNQHKYYQQAPIQSNRNVNFNDASHNTNQIIMMKGSDSSGSNSNQTADSGHESPLTTATLNGQNNSTSITTTTTASDTHEIIVHPGSFMENDGSPASGLFAFGEPLEGYGLISQEAYSMLANDSNSSNHHHHQLAGTVTLNGTPGSLGSSVTCSPAISEQLAASASNSKNNSNNCAHATIPNSGSGLLMLVHEGSVAASMMEPKIPSTFGGNNQAPRSNNQAKKNNSKYSNSAACRQFAGQQQQPLYHIHTGDIDQAEDNSLSTSYHFGSNQGQDSSTTSSICPNGPRAGNNSRHNANLARSNVPTDQVLNMETNWL